MPATFFIGDLHFGHELVSDTRGFSLIEEHDNAIICRWRKQVKPDDLVYVMGDISGGGVLAQVTALQILMSLPGRKRLISGNHDGTSGIHKKAPSAVLMELYTTVFEKINDYSSISFEGHKILLSHYPYWESGDGPVRGPGRYQQFRLPNLGNYLIHAHTHYTHPTEGSATGLELCVSWDAWKRLADMGDIAQWVRKIESDK